eukprot:XP_022259011.1 uncharacterized protein LOC111090036 isoform X9 [Canis lupus familiaris]
MARKKEKIHGSKRKDQSKVKRKDLSFWLLLKLNFSYPCSTAIQEADDHPSHVFQKKEKILLEKTMPSLRTLSTQGQAQQGQRTFRQEIIPSVTRPVSWSTAHNWQEDRLNGHSRTCTFGPSILPVHPVGHPHGLIVLIFVLQLSHMLLPLPGKTSF